MTTNNSTLTTKELSLATNDSALTTFLKKGNFSGIIELGMGTYWFTSLIGLLFFSIFGTVRIIGWIKEGKL